jgi:hypothetical protein
MRAIDVRYGGAVFASLVLLLAFETVVPAQPKLSADIAWASATADDDRYWIKSGEISSQYYPARVTVWLHGEHGYNRRVNYKKSLQRIRFFCNGTLQLVALTTVDSEGHASKWHGDGDVTSITPRTVYQDIEREFCLR